MTQNVAISYHKQNPVQVKTMPFTHSFNTCKTVGTKWRLIGARRDPTTLQKLLSYHYAMQHYLPAKPANAIYTFIQNPWNRGHKMVSLCAHITCCTTLTSQQNWTQNGAYWWWTYTMQQHNQSMPFTHS